MHNKGVSLILATGGSGLVGAAYSAGKPALGVGPGNVPAYVHKDYDVKGAAHDIILSKSFDNGMICASEQAAIVDKEIYDDFVEELKANDVYMVSPEEKAMLEELLFGAAANSVNCAGARLNASIVGKPAREIARLAGFEAPEGTRVLGAEIPDVGFDQPLSREKLSPVLAVVKAENAEDGIDKARVMVEIGGLGHTASVFTNDEAVALEFGEVVDACRIIWNAPASHGAIGALYNDFVPSLTLGCGSFGRNSTTDNISAKNLLNIKLIGRRIYN